MIEFPVKKYTRIVMDYIHDWFLCLLAILESPHFLLYAVLGILALLIMAGLVLIFEE